MTRRESSNKVPIALRRSGRIRAQERQAGGTAKPRGRVLAAGIGRAPKKTSAGQAPRVAHKAAVSQKSGIAQKSTGSQKAAGPDPSREELMRQLAEAETRILELEARLRGVTDRVAWIADRLHGLLDDED